MSLTKILIKTWSVLSDGFIVALSLLGLCGAWSIFSHYVHMPLAAEDVFYLGFGLMLAFSWVPLACLAMYRATPKHLTDRYLKEPHFTAAEIIGRAIMSPLIPFPTTIFMIACTLPRSWLASRWFRRRQMTDLRDHVPRWFVWCSRIIWCGAIVHILLWIGLFVGLGIYDKFIDV